MTSLRDYRLIVDIVVKSTGAQEQAVYDTFKVADGADHYRLTAVGYSGNAGEIYILYI